MHPNTNQQPKLWTGSDDFPPGVYCRYITCILIQTTAQTLDREWWFPTGSLLSLHNMHPNTNQQPKLWTGSDDIPTGSLLSLHNMHPNTNHSPNSGPGVMIFPPGVYCRYITCILIQTTAQTLDWEWWFPTGSLLSLHNMHPNTNQQPKLWTGSDDIPTGSLLSLHNMHPNTNQQPKLWTGSDDIPTGSLLSLHNMHPNTNHSPNSGPGVTTFPPGVYCRYITCILIQTTAQTLDREWWYSHRESTVVT